MKKVIISIILFLITLFSTCVFQVQNVQAKTDVLNFRTIQVNIVRNPMTRHFYFVPTYVPCITGPTRIQLMNTTNSSPVVQLENYVRVVVQPYSLQVETEYVIHNSHWVLLEPNYLGGNAYLYFRRCGFGYALPNNMKNPQPQPYTPPYIPPRSIEPQPIYNPYHRIGAICNDMTRSFAIGRGACSYHQGVNHWLYS